MRRVFIFTPCRTSFALCVLIAFICDPEHASHVTVGEPPRPIHALQPQGATYAP
jgi:hypothetical protein